MEKYNKFLRDITKLIEKGLFASKDIKKDIEQTFLTKTETDPKGPESSEEITDGS